MKRFKIRFQVIDHSSDIPPPHEVTICDGMDRHTSILSFVFDTPDAYIESVEEIPYTGDE